MDNTLAHLDSSTNLDVLFCAHKILKIAKDLLATKHTDTPEFKSWFGNSKTTDESGNPKVYYHGTHKDKLFKQFNAPMSGIWFAHHPENACGGNGEAAKHVYPVHLKAENPYHLNEQELNEFKLAKSPKNWAKMMYARVASKGHDAMVVGKYATVVWHPHQIKSAIGNVGKFDTNNKDITASLNSLQLKQVKSPEFKQWFGDWEDLHAWSSKRDKNKPPVSCAIQDSGHPKVMYHGSRNEFKQFQPFKQTTNSGTFGSWKTRRSGIFFTETPEHASAFTESGGEHKGGNIKPVYLKMHSPLDMSHGLDDFYKDRLVNTGHIDSQTLNHHGKDWQLFDGLRGAKFRKAVLAAGHDSVIFNDEHPETGNSIITHVVFHPHQIKSATANSGKFNPDSKDITATDDNFKPISYDKSNFHLSTGAIFKPVDNPPNRKPDFQSGFGSNYWHTDKGVYRESDHWTPDTASCSWLLEGHHPFKPTLADEHKTGYCDYTDFKNVNSKEWKRQESGFIYKYKKQAEEKNPHFGKLRWTAPKTPIHGKDQERVPFPPATNKTYDEIWKRIPLNHKVDLSKSFGRYVSPEAMEAANKFMKEKKITAALYGSGIPDIIRDIHVPKNHDIVAIEYKNYINPMGFKAQSGVMSIKPRNNHIPKHVTFVHVLDKDDNIVQNKRNNRTSYYHQHAQEQYDKWHTLLKKIGYSEVS